MPLFDWSMLAEATPKAEHIPFAFVEHAVEKAKELWPEVVGGGVAYFLHNVFHGMYHRVGHLALRIVRRGGGH